MTSRRWHRLLGLILLLPLCGWVITGFIFFVKPGYAGAYDVPSVRAYPGPKLPAALAGVRATSSRVRAAFV